MLGHKWEPAQGTIVEAQGGPVPGHVHGGAAHREHRYVIEVRKPAGEVIRGNVAEKSLFGYPVGSTIGVEVNSKTGEIRLDSSAHADRIQAVMQATEQMRGGMGGGGAAGIAGGAAGMAALADVLRSAAASGAGSMHVMGPGGQDVSLSDDQQAEIRSLALSMLGGDSAARRAAAERLRQIKAEAGGGGMHIGPGEGFSGHGISGHGISGQGISGQGFGDEGLSGRSGPATFDNVGAPKPPIPPATPSSPATFAPQVTGAFGEPADSSSFGQPSAPDLYPHVSPAPVGSPSTFGSGGSFDFRVGDGTTEQRIAKLQQLLDRGILTESEFQAQRQQIISGH